ncbi:MAG: hypothetical protein V3V62_15195 [bacterium]
MSDEVRIEGECGALGFADTEARLAFSYGTNFQTEASGGGERVRAVVEVSVGKA